MQPQSGAVPAPRLGLQGPPSRRGNRGVARGHPPGGWRNSWSSPARPVSVQYRRIDNLPAAHDILVSNMPVDGACFFELFAGEAILTVAFMMNNIPCIKPWDHDSGDEFEVVKNELILNHVIDVGIVLASHLGSPCTSFTRARFPVLRNADSVWGVHRPNPEQ